MRLVLTALLLFAAIMTYAQSAEAESTDSLVNWYQERYPFLSQRDTVYTFESEFVFPDGYDRPDPEVLTPYQNWISHFPLWHRHLPVGAFRGGRAFAPEDISRVVDLPWRGPTHTDLGFSLRILAEWLRYRQRDFDLVYVPPHGDTLSYGKWLSSKPVLTAQGAVKLVPAQERDSSAFEYYRFLKTCMEHMDYAALAQNADSVPPGRVRPGDLLVGHSEDGTKGRVFIVLTMLVNNAGGRLYAVATGCEEACDLHIPLTGPSRNSPWITVEQMSSLVEEYPRQAYLRLHPVR